jgi:hypothetical protein
MSDTRTIQAVDLWYPRLDGSRTPDQPTEVRIGLMDVRAADDIVIDYDFDRDGYRIRMPTIHAWDIDDEVCDEGLVEVAFIPAWVSVGNDIEECNDRY